MKKESVIDPAEHVQLVQQVKADADRIMSLTSQLAEATSASDAKETQLASERERIIKFRDKLNEMKVRCAAACSCCSPACTEDVCFVSCCQAEGSRIKAISHSAAGEGGGRVSWLSVS